MRIFLSYRRSDAGGYVGRLSDTLARQLGPDNVFQDVADIAAGQDFGAVIRTALGTADAALAVIGPGWAGASTPEGRRRLLDPGDYVRLEVVTALQRGLPVVPVLVGGAALPEPGDLPDDLRPLLDRQAVVLRDGTWHQDVADLVRSLRGEPPPVPGPGARRRLVAAAVAGVVGLAAVAGLAVWRPWAGNGGGGGGADPGSPSAVSPSCPDPAGRDWATLSPGADPTATEPQPGGGELEFTVEATRWRRVSAGRWQVVVDTSMAVRGPEPAYHEVWRYGALLVAERAFDPSCFEAEPVLVDFETVGDARIGFVVTCEPKGRVVLVTEAARIPVTGAPDPASC